MPRIEAQVRYSARVLAPHKTSGTPQAIAAGKGGDPPRSRRWTSPTCRPLRPLSQISMVNRPGFRVVLPQLGVTLRAFMSPEYQRYLSWGQSVPMTSDSRAVSTTTSNAAPLNARTAATALSSPAPSSISSASTIRTSPRRSAPGSPATDGNSNPNRDVPPTALAPWTDSGSCTNPRHRPTPSHGALAGAARRRFPAYGCLVSLEWEQVVIDARDLSCSGSGG